MWDRSKVAPASGDTSGETSEPRKGSDCATNGETAPRQLSRRGDGGRGKREGGSQEQGLRSSSPAGMAKSGEAIEGSRNRNRKRSRHTTAFYDPVALSAQAQVAPSMDAKGRGRSRGPSSASQSCKLCKAGKGNLGSPSNFISISLRCRDAIAATAPSLRSTYAC